MQRKISKENLTDFAHQAVNSLRRLVGSGGDNYTPAQQDLISSSKQVEERWQRRRLPVDSGTVELWCAGLRDELTYLTSPRDPQNTRKPLPDSAMVSALETARILSRTVRHAAVDAFVDNQIVSLLVKYFMTVPMSKKLRDVCALVLAEVPGDQSLLMQECVEIALPFLAVARPEAAKAPAARAAASAAAAATDSPAPSPEASGGDDKSPQAATSIATSDAEPEAASCESALTVVDTRAVYMASLLVAAIHRADAVSAAEGELRGVYSTDAAVALLESTGNVLMAASVVGNSAGVSSAGVASDSYQVAVAAAYLSLLSGLLRGNTAAKHHIISEHRELFCQAWTMTASSLAQMDPILSVPTPAAGKDALVPLGNAQLWHSELLELLVEVATDDSFTLRRLSVYDAPDNTSPVNGTGADTPGSAVRSPGHSPSAGGGYSFGVRRFEPIPPHWDTLLTGGSPLVWRAASLLSACRVQAKAVGVLQRCLLGLDTSSVLAESLYRSIITTLMLLCVADPHNARCLAENAMFECLTALVTYTQQSVFSAAVELPDWETAAYPVSQLTTNTTQLTESFMSSLAAAYFPKKLVEMLKHGVESMAEGGTCQTDADIVEALLHVLSTSYVPPRVLFFPGCGSAVCKVDDFPGRWSGYSFSAWINPLCVWAEGSHLFSFTDDSGASTTLSVVANGRSCSLALRAWTSKDLAMSVIPDSTMPAETWSHVVFTQGLSGVTVFVNGRKLSSPNISVPFPQAPSKRHRLDLAFGGAVDEPSFFGYVATMDLFEDALSEKDVGRLYVRGPGRGEAAGLRAMMCISASDTASPASSTSPTPISISGSLFDRNESVSTHGVIALSTPNMQVVFAECGVMGWALCTMQASHGAVNFNVVAKLCVSFIATAMRMTNSDAELSTLLGGATCPYMDALKAEVLTWKDTFLDFPSILLAAATPRGGGKALRAHPSTQAILSLLLERLEVVCAVGESAPPHSASTSNTSNNNITKSRSNFHVLRNTVSACSILRELSDCLLVESNVQVFKTVPRRFKQVLAMSLHLPPECIESVVVLVEKLCKCQPDLESTLRFLAQPAGPASIAATAAAGATGTSSSLNTSVTSMAAGSADGAKAEILRMLFDVARADVAMCEMLGACFKGAGASFLITLVNGRSHTSEAIRVFALRLLSLMLHVNRKLRESFVKSHGFLVLSKAITDPRSRVPIRLPTVDCLFQMAFDGYRPTEAADAEMASRLSSTASQAAGKGKPRKSKHHDVVSSATSGMGRYLGFPGHLPGLVSRRLKVTRREYSFEVAHDFARIDDRLQFDESYRSKSAHSTLHVPPAFETALNVLGSLITAVSSINFAVVVPPTPVNGNEGEGGSAGDAGGASSLPHITTGGSGDGESMTSAHSPAHEEEPPEKVVARVLGYLDKVTDVEQNGVALLQYPWMDWLWGAVQAVAIARRGNSAASLASAVTSHRYSKKFTSMVMSYTRHIIRKLVVLDMTRNSKAASIRRIRGIQHPPYLLRIVLEEVVRHFTKGKQEELSDPHGASNVIKNLDTLLHNIEHALDPFPLTLGAEIVASVSAIAVRNNSWVRMRMKKDSALFDIRDRLALFLVTSVKKFAKADAETLLQLADTNANANEMGAVVVLLYRLSRAVDNKDVDEVELLLLLLRRLVTSSEDLMRELYKVLGEGGAQLAELLCVVREDTLSVISHQDTGESLGQLRGPSTSEQTFDMDSQVDGRPAGSGHPLASDSGANQAMLNKLPTSQVIDWCRTHAQQWAAITADCKQKAAKVNDWHSKSSRDRIDKEHSAMAKATRSQQESYAQLDAKVNQELYRILAEVDAELGSHTS